MTDAVVMTIEGVRTRASTGEALVTFSVPLENAALVSGFMAKVGRQVGAAFADIDNDHGKNSGLGRAAAKPAIKETKPYGREARALKLSGFFRVPEVWKAIGTDEQFREWVQRQPSAWSGASDWVESIGEGRCEAAHVSRIEFGRGIAHKPEYACIPLTHAEHMNHHAKGESVFNTPKELGRDWMERMRIQYVSDWAWECVKTELGFDSMGNVPPTALLEWAKWHGVDQYLPGEYLGQK